MSFNFFIYAERACMEVKKLQYRFSLLLLLLLLLCGTASAELVYTVESKDYSIGRVNYDAGGLPQNETVLKDIKASGLYFDDVYSTDKGEWRVLTETTSRDVNNTYSYSYSLYNPDGNWKSPLGKTQNFKGYGNVSVSDSGIFVVSEDYSSVSTSSDIFKFDKETLAEKAKKSGKGSVSFSLRDISLLYNGKAALPASLTLLDENLNQKGEPVTYDKGYYGIMASLGGGSFALAFYSEDVQVVEQEGGMSVASVESVTTTDLGIFKISGSTKTAIVTSVDVGLNSASGQWRIGDLISDLSGGLYFLVDKNGSTALYHWNGSKTTLVYETEEGESWDYNTAFDDSDNLYFTVYKSTKDRETYTETYTYTAYRWSAAQSKLTKMATSNSWLALGGTSGGRIVYLTASDALYRCTASLDTPTQYKPAEGGIGSVTADDGGNLYFTVSKSELDNKAGVNSYKSSALYRWSPSQATPDKLHEVTDGSYISNIDAYEASSEGVYFAAVKEGREKVEEEDYSYYDYYASSYAFCHYDGTDVSTIHTFSDVQRYDTDRKVDEKHKMLYLWARSHDDAAGTTLVAFDNTDRHNPEKLKEFNIAGEIRDVVLYNDKGSVSPETTKPIKPTTYTTTPKIEEKYVSQAPASGWTSFPITGIVDANGTPSPAKTVFYIWINIISRLSVAANLADDEWGPYLLESEEEGKLELDISKLKNLDGTPVTDFPGGDCIITYSTTLDGKGGFSGKTEQQVKVAKSSSSSGGGSSSSGCDTGFGALAMAALAAGALLKKRSR